jgi:hypothetical protein
LGSQNECDKVVGFDLLAGCTSQPLEFCGQGSIDIKQATRFYGEIY